MFGLPYWLLVIPVLGFLVLIHELGHFITAKYFRIAVTEFGIGFPPRLFGVRIGETLYSVNAIPLGGFVKMVGEEDPEHPRSFANQSIIKRVVVLCSGSLMNLLFPIIVFSLIFALPHKVWSGSIAVTGVAPKSPAALAGLKPGDTILKIGDKTVVNHIELVKEVMTNVKSQTKITVRRGAAVSGLSSSPELSPVEELVLIPRLNPPEYLVVSDDKITSADEINLREARQYNAQLSVGDIMMQGPVGIMIETQNLKSVSRRHSIWTAIPMSLTQIESIIIITKNGILGWLTGGRDPGFTGPVGIAQITGQAAKAGLSTTLELMALISISLGVFNLMPIPALDGGRLMFVILEWARKGKRISPDKESKFHLLGFIFLITIILFISYKDILHILNGDSFVR